MGKFLLFAASLSLTTACGGTSGPPPEKADAGETPDPADAMPMNTCTDIESYYADLGEVTGTASLEPIDDTEPDGPKILSIQIPLNEDAEPDVLFLELWEDSPPFDETGFVPVTRTLNGDQADLVLCGACAFIAADYTQGGLINFNMASGGQLVIDTVDTALGTGSITGSMTGLRFREVTVSEAGQEVVENGCVSEIEGVTFNFAMPAAP